MTDAIAAGTILMQDGAHLPNFQPFERKSDSSGWTPVENSRPAFEKEVREPGWTFFFMAGEIRATVFGFDRQKTLRTALKRLIRNVKSQNCNSIEITRVTGESFLKLPYVSVSAHPRHLQKGMVFQQAFYNSI
jgi:hypothetical protein